jgi:hypothetical protein
MEGDTTLSIQVGEAAPEILYNLDQFGTNLHVNHTEITMNIDNRAIVPDVVRYLASHNIDIYAITPRHHTLEERFIEILGTDGGL